MYDIFSKLADSHNYLKMIDKEHTRIHEGQHYFVKDYLTMSSANDSRYFMFIVPSSDGINAKFIANPYAEFIFELFEDATYSSEGTPVLAINNNRNSTRVASLLAYASPTLTSTGTLIWRSKTGSGKNAGVSPAQGYEIIPRSNTAYVWKLTKTAAGESYVDFDFFWYEE